MCGIVGLFGSDCKTYPNDKREYMLQGLFVDALRGQESTGIALLPKETSKDPVVFKRALSGPDFVNRKEVSRIVGRLDLSLGMIGHNRSATRGDIEDENAHPFQYGHITLVHNGTVNNADFLTGEVCKADSKVDSAQVAWSFSKKEPDELLPRMTGGFSLVWWDARDNTLHFARNHEKPMYWYTSPDSKMMYFGSELAMLAWLLTRRNMPFNPAGLFTAPNHHYIFKNPLNLGEYERRPFYEQPRKKGKRYKPTHHTPVILGPNVSSIMNTQTKNSTPMHTDSVLPGGTTKFSKDGTAGGLRADGKEHPVEREDISKDLATTIINAGSNGDSRRIAQLKTLAEDISLPLAKTIVAEPRKWLNYKQETKMGFMLCKHNGTQAVVQIFNVTMGDWNRYSMFGRVPIKVTNFRASYALSDTTVFIGEVDERLFNNMYDRWRTKQQPSYIEHEAEDMIEVGQANPVHVTPKRFREMVEDGCYNCSSEIKVEDSDSVMWFGPKEEWPLCERCSKEEVVVSQWQAAAKAALELKSNVADNADVKH